MKKILVLLTLGALGYFIYSKYLPRENSVSTDGYSLKTAAEKPIPRDAFFALWTEEALSKCGEARGNYNLSTPECHEKISEKARACTASAIKKAPSNIDSLQLVKSLGRSYLECVTPYFYCGGVEVKTEDEVRRLCK